MNSTISNEIVREKIFQKKHEAKDIEECAEKMTLRSFLWISHKRNSKMSGKEASKIFDDGELKLQLNEKIFKFHNER